MSFRRAMERHSNMSEPRPPKPPENDTRYVYGAGCTWNDSIYAAGRTKPQVMNGRSFSLPCCPFCGSMLMETRSEAMWWEGVKDHDEKHPGYEAACRWSKGKCFKTPMLMFEAYNAETGANFVL